MRVLHVIASLDPAGGGPPQVAARIAAAQAAAGMQVTVLGFAPRTPQAQQQTRQMLENVPGFDRVVKHDVRAGASLRAAWRTVDEQVAQADFVHMHGVWDRLVVLGALCARRRRCPYVFRPAGMLDRWSMAQKAWKKHLAMTLGIRRLLNGAAFLHVLNEDEAAGLAPLGLRAPREVIPNGVFLNEVDPLPAPGVFREKWPGLGDDPFVLFLSRLHFKKGLDYLVDAFNMAAEKHPTARLVVAGPDDGYEAQVRKHVHAAGLDQRVVFTGPIYGRDKYAAMVDATCFCLPSRQEGFSVAITEALACGCPAVISRDCHFPEVAQVDAGFVSDLDASQVARGLVDLLDDAELRHQMGAKARKLVEQRYTWPVIAQQVISAYRQHGQGAPA